MLLGAGHELLNHAMINESIIYALADLAGRWETCPPKTSDKLLCLEV